MVISIDYGFFSGVLSISGKTMLYTEENYIISLLRQYNKAVADFWNRNNVELTTIPLVLTNSLGNNLRVFRIVPKSISWCFSSSSAKFQLVKNVFCDISALLYISYTIYRATLFPWLIFLDLMFSLTLY